MYAGIRHYVVVSGTGTDDTVAVDIAALIARLIGEVVVLHLAETIAFGLLLLCSGRFLRAQTDQLPGSKRGGQVWELLIAVVTFLVIINRGQSSIVVQPALQCSQHSNARSRRFNCPSYGGSWTLKIRPPVFLTMGVFGCLPEC